MKAFVTGATGFVGGRLAAALRARGDDVVALVRSPDKAGALTMLGCTLVPGDLSDEGALAQGMDGCDAAFHVAAAYKVGIPKSEHSAMYEANVRGTERVFDAAEAAGVSRIVYVSTIGIFGDTHGEVVDETYERPDNDFLSYYEETKYLAHKIALARVADGAPIVIVQPGGIYGPGDQSDVATVLTMLREGKLKLMLFPETGFNLVYVDDVVDGILLAHDKGRVGESYALGGEITTLRRAIEKVAPMVGRKAPKHAFPASVVRMSAPLGPLIGRALGLPTNFKELVKASDDVTYWAADDKARRELGYAPRTLDEGLELTVAAG